MRERSTFYDLLLCLFWGRSEAPSDRVYNCKDLFISCEDQKFWVLVLMLVSFYCVNAKLLCIFIVTCLSTCSPFTGLALSVREAVMI